MLLLALACVAPDEEIERPCRRDCDPTETNDTAAVDTAPDDTAPDDTGGTDTDITDTGDGIATWTMLVYMVGDNDLEVYVMHDLEELEAGGPEGPGGEVRVITLSDRAEGYAENGGDWTGTRLYEIIGDDGAHGVGSPILEDWGEQNMADPATLARFLEVGAALAPAEHYALVLWNHGSSWPIAATPPPGIGNDDSADGDDLSIAEGELSAGLAAFTDTHGLLDVIAFDACNMAYFEVGHALSAHARYLVASQNVVGGEGLQYTDSLQSLVADPNQATASFADSMARDAVELAGESTYSATDLSQMDAVATALDGLAGVALAEATAWDALLTAREDARGVEPEEEYRLWYLDLGDLADQAAGSENDALAGAGAALRAATENAMVGAYGIEDLAWTSGLNIHAETTALGLYSEGAGATWATATRWDEVLLQIAAEEPDSP